MALGFLSFAYKGMLNFTYSCACMYKYACTTRRTIPYRLTGSMEELQMLGSGGAYLQQGLRAWILGGGGSIYRYFIYGILYYIRLHYTIFYYIILHYTVLYCIVLYCIISCLKSVASANPAHEVQAALTHKRRGTILSLGDAMQEGPPLRAHVAAGTLELPSLPCELHTGGDILRHVEEKALRPGTGGDDCAISGSCCCCLPRNA